MGDDAGTAEGATCSVGRGEQGKARPATSALRGGLHLELGHLRCKSDFSIAHTWRTLSYIYIYISINCGPWRPKYTNKPLLTKLQAKNNQKHFRSVTIWPQGPTEHVFRKNARSLKNGVGFGRDTKYGHPGRTTAYGCLRYQGFIVIFSDVGCFIFHSCATPLPVGTSRRGTL